MSLKNKKSIFFVGLTLIMTIVLCAMVFCAVDESEKQVVYESEQIITSKADDLSNVKGELANVVIFITFSDSKDVKVSDNIINLFDGETNSLVDYVDTLSFGKYQLNNIFPYSIDNTTFLYYKDLNTRGYYAKVDDSSGKDRYDPESKLLNRAVNWANENMDFDGVDLDRNGDGYVDSVSFVVEGTPNYNGWGELFWPHSWQLDTITGISSSRGRSSKLGELYVETYSFTFMGQEDLGLITHEYGHVLGAPDLYHTEYDKDRLPVGVWDLMHRQDKNLPQLMTTYLRQKYLHVVGDEQVQTIYKNGVYTLNPTITANSSDLLAYNVKVNEYESIWIEFRSNHLIGSYDSNLPGSGLVIYRTNSRAEGNTEAKYENTRYPDEVYVYRPDYYKIGSTSTRETNNLEVAYLSKTNQYFSQLGTLDNDEDYNPSNIFLTSGSNTGIVIKVVDQSKTSLSFSIECESFDKNEPKEIESLQIEQTKDIFYGDDVKECLELTAKIKNEDKSYILDSKDYILEYQPEIVGRTQIATIKIFDGVNSIVRDINIEIKECIQSVEIVELPDKDVYFVGENLTLTGLVIEEYWVNKTEKVKYEDNKNRFSAMGFDSEIGGDKNIILTYTNGDFSQEMKFIVKVTKEITGIKIDKNNTQTLIKIDTNPKIVVLHTYDDGTEEVLGSNDYSVTNIDIKSPGQYTDVTITSNISSFYAKMSITVIDSEKEVSSCVINNNKLRFEYGEALDCSEGKMIFTFTDGSKAQENLSAYYDTFAKQYKPNVSNQQTLVAKIFSYDVSFTISVNQRNDSLLQVKSDYANVININNVNNTIVVKSGSNLGLLFDNLSSYLEIVIEYEHKPVTKASHGEMLIKENISVVLSNKNNDEIAEYKVRLLGDIDGNGLVDSADIDRFATLIISSSFPTYNTYFYMDFNNNMEIDISDFVCLIDFVNGVEN